MPSRDDFCPVAKTVSLVGDQWSLLVVREMLRGVRHFNQLSRSVPGISRSILARRLKALEGAGLVRRTAGRSRVLTEYQLTAAGRDLGRVVGSLAEWGLRWLIPEAEPVEIDPDGLMQWIWRHVELGELPRERVVVAFEVLAQPPRRFWLVVRDGDVALCPEHPGFDEDLEVRADPRALYRLVLAQTSLHEAIDRGVVEVNGPPELVRSLARWLRLRTQVSPTLARAHPH